MTKRQQHCYEFGGFVLDVDNHVLWRGADPVPLQPKAFETLLLLVERRHEVVSKDELMKRLWPDSYVEEANLSQNIYVIRKTLAQAERDEEFIKTIPKRGYQFVADVQELGEEADVIFEERIHMRVVSEQVLDEDGPTNNTTVAAPATAIKLPMAIHSRRTRVVALVVAVTVASGAYLASRLIPRKQPALAAGSQVLNPTFQGMNLKRLTDIGKVTHPVISPDGKYLAYVLRDEPNDKTSLWVKHIPTDTAKQIVPPAGVAANYEAPIFSPDGSFIYFLRHENGVNTLYRVAVLGDSPRKLIEDVWGRVAPSPDGRRLAFVRVKWNEGEHTLLLANTDGTGERPLAVRKRPEYFNVFGIGPSWSPDGKTIACSGGSSAGGRHDDAIIVDADSGAQRSLSGRNWHSMGQVAWMPDGSALLVPANEKSGAPQQVWRLSYPAGEVRRLTNDLNDYEMLSLTTGSSLVAQQSEQITNLWVMAADAGRAGLAHHSRAGIPATQITSGVSRRDGFYGLAWTPDGQIVYASNAGGLYDLWIVNADGSAPRRITESAGESNIFPSVSPDGRFVVFSSDRSGENNIWRVDIDGRNAVQLTHGKDEYHTSFSRDGRWVIYESAAATTSNVWKVSIDGGEPVRLTDHSAGHPVTSSDGALIAYIYFDEHAESPWRLGVMPFNGGAAIRSFPQPFRCFDWSPAGDALTYIVGTNTVSNLWNQPLDGGPPEQLTDFGEQRIYCFSWSRDGKHIALARGNWNSDAVMISDFK